MTKSAFGIGVTMNVMQKQTQKDVKPMRLSQLNETANQSVGEIQRLNETKLICTRMCRTGNFNDKEMTHTCTHRMAQKWIYYFLKVLSLYLDTIQGKNYCNFIRLLFL